MINILTPQATGRILISAFLTIAFLNTSLCQQSATTDITDGSYYHEEVYVISDRDIYFTGERVQLRLELLNMLSGTPAETSRVVYVELIDQSGNPSVQIKAGLTGSSGSAELTIPDTLRTGNYIIRSGTAWMHNFSVDLLSHRLISVINPFEIPATRKLPEAFPAPDSVFFSPESGSLVAGHESVVGLRCFSRKGNPVSIKGYIINESSDTIAEAGTGVNGYGLFKIKPDTTSRLFLLFQNTGTEEKIPLPPVIDNGVTLSLTDENKETFTIRTSISTDLIARDQYFLTYSHVSLPPVRKELSPGRENETVLFKKDLPSGPAYISISDGKGEIRAGRWIFNNPGDQPVISATINKREYGPREKVSIEITATDGSGSPVRTGLSVSVVKSVLVSGDNTFTSTRGSQTAPLAVMKPELSADLKDLNSYLIFVKGFGRKGGSGLNGLEAPFRFPEMEGHLVSGIIRNTSDGEPLANENIVMSYVGRSAQCSFTRSDENGHFNFIIRDYGKKEIVIQPLSGSNNNYYVEINNPFPEVRRKYNLSTFNIDSSRLEEINRAVISMQVRSVYEPFTKVENAITEGPQDFYGKPDLTIRLDDYISLTSFREVIKELLPGVSTYRKNDQTGFRLINKYPNMAFETDPLVVVDGVPVKEADKVLMIDSDELEKVDILNTRYFYSDIM
ncbi:MAG: hypothetical protein RBU28_11615, partial [Bacteroidales bacterium]|nr:hypothetical protein [Bacteroidales bacterium]